MKNGAKINGTFKSAITLMDIPMTDEWVYADYGYEAYIKTSEIASMEIVSMYSSMQDLVLGRRALFGKNDNRNAKKVNRD